MIILDEKNVLIMGINRAISTSKIKKIIVIRKNRKEKGIRDDEIGSNPHSKGDIFSKSNFIFFDNNIEIFIVIVEIVIIIKVIKVKIKIIYIN